MGSVSPQRMISYGFNLQGRILLAFSVIFFFFASGLGVFLNSTIFKEDNVTV